MKKIFLILLTLTLLFSGEQTLWAAPISSIKERAEEAEKIRGKIETLEEANREERKKLQAWGKKLKELKKEKAKKELKRNIEEDEGKQKEMQESIDRIDARIKEAEEETVKSAETIRENRKKIGESAGEIAKREDIFESMKEDCEKGGSKDAIYCVQLQEKILNYKSVRGSYGFELISVYIHLLYKYLASMIGIIAVLIIVFSGGEIMLGGADAERVTSAKTRIGQTLLSMALLFCTALILRTVNPGFFAPEPSMEAVIEAAVTPEEEGPEIEGDCPLITYRSSNFVGEPAKIHPDFEKTLKILGDAISKQGGQIHVTSSFRTTTNVKGAIVTPAKRSNHMVGHAIDCNIKKGADFCKSECMSAQDKPWVKAFFDSLPKSTMIGDFRWGGMFRTKDPVHFDDGYNQNKTAWDEKYKEVQGKCAK